MDTLSDQLNDLASQWALLSQWLFPTIWLLLGVYAYTKHRFAGAGLVLAGASSLLFSFLFAPGSSFTEGWQTDAPLNVYFSYKPIGYLAANLLPAISNFALALALLALLRRRG
jgi:hypothetical protein